MYGYDVLTSGYAEAAESIRANPRVNVVVIDADLAEKHSGISVARVAQEVNPKIDLVYTSRMPHRAAAALRLAGAPILRDPYRPHQLADVIAHLRYRASDAPDASAA
jgi:hypothetical protein